MNPDQIWWRSVCHPAQFLEDVQNCIENEKSLLMVLDQNAPWQAYVENALYDMILLHFSNKNVQKLYEPIDNPGTYFIAHYCPEDERMKFRLPATPASFLADPTRKTTFHSYVFFAQVDTDQQLRTWNSFIKEYLARKKEEKALFILTSPFYSGSMQSLSIPVFSYEDQIEGIDHSVFADLLSSSVRLKNPALKPYLAELANALCQQNPELASHLIRLHTSFLENPQAVLRQVFEEEQDSNGRVFIQKESDDQISQHIWEAQIKTVFPVLERYRRVFLDLYGQNLEQNLPIADAWGNVLDTPNELELGQIVYCLSNDEVYIPDDIWQRLNLFKDVRNILAHLQILSLSQVEAVLSWDEQQTQNSL
jgi:hypothetical protein